MTRCAISAAVRGLAAAVLAWPLASTTLAATPQPDGAAAAAPTLCVWDPIGSAGPLFEAARGYALAMQKAGFELRLKPYTDERVATEDFRVGQCQALIATSIRTKRFIPISAAVDYMGSTTIVRDGKIDLEASYETARKAIAVFASPGAAKLVVQDRFELGGIIPAGWLYTFARDRQIFSQGFAGKRLPAFDHDKVQAYLILKAGAQPVAADISNYVQMFNNGNVDVLFSPAVVYKPLEIYRGVGTKGGVSRLPIAFTSTQMVFDRERFGAGFGEQSRGYWSAGFDEALRIIRKAEADIPPQTWVDYSAEDLKAFTAYQRDTRVELGRMGLYNKQGLKILKRVRCSVHPGAPDCTSTAEIDW